jgi:hypothetical protein
VTDDAPTPEPSTGQRRLLLTVGEVVAVLGLGLAALNFWDSHHDRTKAELDRARTEAQAKAEAQKAPPFVMRATADADGRRIMLEPLDAGQAIQSQRYLLPTPVLDHAMAIDAGRPQVDLAWFEEGLKGQLKAARKAGASLPKGEAELPIGVVTTYVEGGVMRTDRSLYRIGYVVDHGFLGALKPRLQGMSLVARDVKTDLGKRVDARWRDALPIPVQGEASSR